MLAAAAFTVPAQVRVVPGSAVRGEQLLDDHGCLSCHTSGFVPVSGQPKTPAQLAAALWNHSPEMWKEHTATQRQIPRLTSSESADLFAYFYSTLYFAPQGDPARGQGLFQEKNCASCHSEVLDTRPSDSLVRRWMDLNDPVGWAERMWNHSNEMFAATSNRGIAWPKFSEQEMVDLVVFLGRLSPNDPQDAAFGIGEPERGRLIFEGSCESCHSFGEAFGSRVNLLARPRPASVIGYAAAMWNHAPLMLRSGTSVSTTINPGDMRDLVAFLFSQRYFFEQGDAGRGARVYETKNCAACHEGGRGGAGAPDLSRSTEEYSPITLTTALWQHGPTMLEAMQRQGLAWPKFEGTEMTDLIAYLNSRLIVRIGR
jgi:mono/diheme cytochrome c family protein